MRNSMGKSLCVRLLSPVRALTHRLAFHPPQPLLLSVFLLVDVSLCMHAWFGYVSGLLVDVASVAPTACPTLDELYQIASEACPDPETTFVGLVRDQQLQMNYFQELAVQDAVLPFVQTASGLYMDLRFAPFTTEHALEESKHLEVAGHVSLLETSATGKSTAILDLGRREYLIYIRCTVPKEDFHPVPYEFSSLREQLFPAVVELIEDYCAHDRRLSTVTASSIARSLILADLCSRLCFLVWYVNRSGSSGSAEKFLLAQLDSGQDVMMKLFRQLMHCTFDSLCKLLEILKDELSA